MAAPAAAPPTLPHIDIPAGLNAQEKEGLERFIERIDTFSSACKENNEVRRLWGLIARAKNDSALDENDKALSVSAFKMRLQKTMLEIGKTLGFAILFAGGSMTVTWLMFEATLTCSGAAVCGIWSICILAALGALVCIVAACLSLVSLVMAAYIQLTNI